MNEQARYTAACAQDINNSAHLYSDTINSIAILVGVTMTTQAVSCRDSGLDFWPVAGAEYAARVVNEYSGDPEDDEAIALLTAKAVYHALIGGASEGNDYSLWDKA